MTDRYLGKIECPYCKKQTEYYFAQEWAEIQFCQNCEKKFKMELKFETKKLK